MAVTSGTGTTTGSTLATYRYNDEGIRISKTVAGVEHTYMYNGGQLAGELLDNGIALIYLYDEAGGVIGMKYHTASDSLIEYASFFFEKNLQGDIVAIYNESGTKIGGYTYDAWGKTDAVTETTATAIEKQIVEKYNPFRYRGYYYDTETGLYYLQSRYYNPEWGRFLSADAIAVITASPTMLTDKNLYAYCDNNPITRRDDGGEFWGVLGKVVLGVGIQYVSDVVGNVLAGETGWDILKPTSSLGEYIAAGVTSILPGSGFGGAIVKNVATEGILSVERAILGEENNILSSIGNIAVGSIIDVGFEKVSNKVRDTMFSKTPHTYSAYAGQARRSNPNLTRQEIYGLMRNTTKQINTKLFFVNVGLDFFRNMLPV